MKSSTSNIVSDLTKQNQVEQGDKEFDYFYSQYFKEPKSMFDNDPYNESLHIDTSKKAIGKSFHYILLELDKAGILSAALPIIRKNAKAIFNGHFSELYMACFHLAGGNALTLDNFKLIFSLKNAIKNAYLIAIGLREFDTLRSHKQISDTFAHDVKKLMLTFPQQARDIALNLCTEDYSSKHSPKENSYKLKEDEIICLAYLYYGEAYLKSLINRPTTQFFNEYVDDHIQSHAIVNLAKVKSWFEKGHSKLFGNTNNNAIKTNKDDMNMAVEKLADEITEHPVAVPSPGKR